jgi:choice-of-anchor C domain-containing protein
MAKKPDQLETPRQHGRAPVLGGAVVTWAKNNPKSRQRMRAIGAALLATICVASLAGITVSSTTAGADPVNLLTNGDFETTPTPTTSFLPVLSGDSTTLPGWTVTTPSTYGGSNGSIDLISANYWNPEHGNYSIDLAGTSGTPGGVYQDVATVQGAQYLLSYWSAVNGDEAPGTTHMLNVTFDGTVVATIQEAGVGRPLVWVQHTITVTADSTTSRVEFDDATGSDTNQGPALDNVSLTSVADTISATPATIAPQTTGTAFTSPVATFTDSNVSAPATSFSATITWGDGTAPTTGTVTGSAGSFTVGGTHTYAAHGTYTVGVAIASSSGGSGSTSDTATVADAVTTCTGSGCSGSVTTPQQTVGISSTSTTGTILTTVDGAGFSCGDSFRHAPQETTVTDTGLNANILYTITFKNKAAAGQWFIPFAVCYQAQTPFKDLYGHTVTTGLLPVCTLLPRPNKPLVAPCVQSIIDLPLFLGNVVEKVVLPPGDPRFH